jgi:WD40 repeat protein
MEKERRPFSFLPWDVEYGVVRVRAHGVRGWCATLMVVGAGILLAACTPISMGVDQDPPSGEPTGPAIGEPLVVDAHVGHHGAVAFSPLGDALIVGAERFDFPSLEHRWTAAPVEIGDLRFMRNGFIEGAAWSPDGSRVALAGYTTWVYDAVTGEVLIRLQDRASDAVAWSQDGRFIASGSRNLGGGIEPGDGPMLWDAATGERLWLLDVTEYVATSGYVASASFAKEGEFIGFVFGGRFPRGALVANTATGAVERFLPTTTQGLAFSGDGSAMAYVNEVDLVVVAVPSFHELRRAPHGVSDRVGFVAWDDAGLLVGSADGALRGFTSELVLESTYAAGPAVLADVDLHAGDGTLALASSGEGVALLERTTLSRTSGFVVYPGRIEAIASREGVVASGGEDGRVRLWDLTTGAQAGEVTVSRDGVTALAFSPDGATLWAGSGFDTGLTVKAWNADTLQPLHAFDDTQFAFTWVDDIVGGPRPDEVTILGAWFGAGSSGVGGVRLDAATGATRETWSVPGALALAISPTALAWVGLDAVSVRGLDDAAAVTSFNLPSTEPPSVVAVSDDGRFVAVGFFHHDEVAIWDVESRALVFHRQLFGSYLDSVDLHGTVLDLDFSSDGAKLLASVKLNMPSQNPVQVIDVHTGAVSPVVPFGDHASFLSFDVDWTADGKILVGTWSGSISRPMDP